MQQVGKSSYTRKIRAFVSSSESKNSHNTASHQPEYSPRIGSDTSIGSLLRRRECRRGAGAKTRWLEGSSNTTAIATRPATADGTSGRGRSRTAVSSTSTRRRTLSQADRIRASPSDECSGGELHPRHSDGSRELRDGARLWNGKPLADAVRICAGDGVCVRDGDDCVLWWSCSCCAAPTTVATVAFAARGESCYLRDCYSGDLGGGDHSWDAVIGHCLAWCACRDCLGDDLGCVGCGVGFDWAGRRTGCWRWGDGDRGGAVGDNAWVLWDERSANTLEVRQSLRNSGSVDSVGGNAVDDVLGEVRVLAEACVVAVVLAAG
jgi:hypothetical protein